MTEAEIEQAINYWETWLLGKIQEKTGLRNTEGDTNYKITITKSSNNEYLFTIRIHPDLQKGLKNYQDQLSSLSNDYTLCKKTKIERENKQYSSIPGIEKPSQNPENSINLSFKVELGQLKKETLAKKTPPNNNPTPENNIKETVKQTIKALNPLRYHFERTYTVEIINNSVKIKIIEDINTKDLAEKLRNQIRSFSFEIELPKEDPLLKQLRTKLIEQKNRLQRILTGEGLNFWETITTWISSFFENHEKTINNKITALDGLIDITKQIKSTDISNMQYWIDTPESDEVSNTEMLNVAPLVRQYSRTLKTDRIGFMGNTESYNQLVESVKSLKV
jgi:hypothetical protein